MKSKASARSARSARSTQSRNERRKYVKQPHQKGTQMKQKELDSTCHRLSRPADKFASAKASMNSDSEFYSVAYFKKFPNLKDESKPEDKLQRLNEQLKDENLSSEDRFAALVKKKAVTTIFYGQESPEAIKAIAALGSFYKKEGKPSSAIRHYEKAREIKRSVHIKEKESMLIDIETAESYLAIEAQKESAISENTNKASKVINPYANTEIDDPKIAYRRDAVLARIAARRGKVSDAEKYYIDAKNHLDEANKGEKTFETGVIDFELAKVFTAENKHQTAGQLYQSAYDTFVELEMNDEAEFIKPFLPTGSEVDEQYEQEEDKYEENTETNSLIETHNAIERNLLNTMDSNEENTQQEKDNEAKSPSTKSSSSSSSSSDHQTKDDDNKIDQPVAISESKETIAKSSSDNEISSSKVTEPEPKSATSIHSDHEDHSNNGNFDESSDAKDSSSSDENAKTKNLNDGSDLDDFEKSSENESDKEDKGNVSDNEDKSDEPNKPDLSDKGDTSDESDNHKTSDSDIMSGENFDDDFNDDE